MSSSSTGSSRSLRRSVSAKKEELNSINNNEQENKTSTDTNNTSLNEEPAKRQPRSTRNSLTNTSSNRKTVNEIDLNVSSVKKEASVERSNENEPKQAAKRKCNTRRKSNLINIAENDNENECVPEPVINQDENTLDGFYSKETKEASLIVNKNSKKIVFTVSSASSSSSSSSVSSSLAQPSKSSIKIEKLSKLNDVNTNSSKVSLVDTDVDVENTNDAVDVVENTMETNDNETNDAETNDKPDNEASQSSLNATEPKKKRKRRGSILNFDSLR